MNSIFVVIFIFSLFLSTGYSRPGNTVTSCKEVVGIDDGGSAEVVPFLFETHHPRPLGLGFEMNGSSWGPYVPWPLTTHWMKRAVILER